MSVQPVPVKASDFRRADRLRGLLMVGVTFVLCLLISLWAKRRARPEVSAPPAPPTALGIIGFPNAIDVMKTLSRARELTPRNLLHGISIDGVDTSGNVDVTGAGRVRYSFQSAPGEGPQPAREPGTLARRPYCGRQSVVVNKDGIAAETDAAETSCAPHLSDPLPEPHCTLAEIWGYGLAHGARKDRLAHIEYYRSVAGPAWRFDAGGGHNRFVLYGDCKRELAPHESPNIAP